jgi:hypothetical protein
LKEAKLAVGTDMVEIGYEVEKRSEERKGGGRNPSNK